jgi:phasin family protein
MAKRVNKVAKAPVTAVPFADPVVSAEPAAIEPPAPDVPASAGDSLSAVIATAIEHPTEAAVAPAVEAVDAAANDLPEPAAPAAVTEAAETAVTHPAEAAVDTVQEDTETMATTFENTTTAAPKMFGDINERAKAAMEKSGQVVAEMNEFGKGNVEAIVESSRIALRGFEALGQDAAEYSRKSFEGLTATLKNLASVKSPTEFFKLQSDYVRASFDQAVAQSSKSTEAMIKLAGDAAQPLSNRMAVAADKVKTVA